MGGVGTGREGRINTLGKVPILYVW